MRTKSFNMLRFFKFVTSIILFLQLSSCSTDVDNYADYKDVTIVYGLLESNADTTFMKITKAFLGPGNALLFAQNPDSSNYPGKVIVQLKGVKNNIDLPVITLDTITIKNKLAGDSIFYFPEQKLYYTTSAIDQNAEYTLVVNKGEQEITAKTKLVQDFGITLPINRINFAATAATTIRWNSAVNGKRHEIILIFHYEELLPGSADTVFKTLQWNLGTKSADYLTGGQQLEVSYLGDNFYSRLQQQLDASALNVRRFAGLVDIIISAGGESLSTYIDVNAPNNSIVQEVPQYSNIDNGFGIFSSRKTIKRSYRMTVQSELKLVENFNWGFELKPVP